MRTHPHAEATYRVVSLAGGGFGVEVTVPDTFPATVSSFATAEEAEAWIARTRERVQSDNMIGRSFNRRGAPPRRNV